MRANNVGITTEIPPEFLEALRKAGPTGQEILDAYRKRLTTH